MRGILPTGLTRRAFASSLLATCLTGIMPQPSPQPACALDVPRTIKLATGAEMPMIGLGTWESNKGEVEAAVTAALDAGYRHIDCAPVYRNEHEVGQALAKSAVPRADLWLTSKLWNDRRRPADVRAALEKTLASLETDYLDLYLIHWPVVWTRDTVMKPDAGASIAECWRTLEALVEEGKVRNIGVSNFGEEELAALLQTARVKPAVNQIELHPRLPQTALLDYCQRHGIAVTAYSPLGRGSVKGAHMIDNPTVQELATTHGVSAAAVLLRWNLQRNVIVIPKSTNPSRRAHRTPLLPLLARAPARTAAARAPRRTRALLLLPRSDERALLLRATPCAVASNLNDPYKLVLTAAEVSQLEAAVEPGRFCSPPWATFADSSSSQRLLGSALTQVARVIFSVAWLDVTKW